MGKHRDAKVTVFAIWEPILPTDWSAPGDKALSRLSDARVMHFWDKEHLVAHRMAADFPDVKPSCCNREGTYWDLMAVYPPGVKWGDKLPAPRLFDGTMVRTQPRLESTLAEILGGK